MSGTGRGWQVVNGVWSAGLTVAVAVLALSGGTGGETASADGSPREVVFADPETDEPVVRVTSHMPDPQVQGTVYPRSVAVAGLQLMDDEGNEMGGLATIPEDRRAMILCFDYETAEATCLSRIERDITFTIMEPPPPDAEVGRPGPERFGFGHLEESGLTYLRLKDEEGRTRIRLEVDSTGTPVIEALDEEGGVVFTSRGSSGSG